MTLNEAIREGCRKAPTQLYYEFTNSGGACVLGAYWIGSSSGAGAYWPSGFFSMPLTKEAEELPAMCPVVGCNGYEKVVAGIADTCLAVMRHLNNEHRWTREAIAEWADPHPELHLPMPSLVNAPSEPTVRCAT